MQRVLGIDYGEKRIGLAISDALGITAQRLETLANSSPAAVLKALTELLGEYESTTVVIGLPRNMDGSEGFKAEETRKFGDSLAEATGATIIWRDERMTSVMANDVITQTVKGKRNRAKVRKEQVDGIAAQLILQSYLDTQP